MEPIHKDIAKYMSYMQSKRYLNNHNQKGIIIQLKKIYFHFRPAIFFALLCVNAYGLSGVEKMGMLDGTFVFCPLLIGMFSMTSIAYVKHSKHVGLLMSLNKNYLKHNEPWMVAIQEKYSKSAWEIAHYLTNWSDYSCYAYALGPIIADTVLHYGLDWLDRPLYLPGCFTPFFVNGVTWDAKYYVMTLLGLWSVWELMDIQPRFIMSYLLLSNAYLIELVIFKEQVKSLKLEAAQRDIDQQFRTITAWHEEIMALNRELKAFLGLPCAFQTLFTTFSLTVTSFTACTSFQSTNIPVVLGNSSGFIFYFGAGLLYCTLGQLLENESEEVFTALYNLPWYRYTPAVRQDLVMMLRQARTPLIIDYHDKAKMNLANFKQILQEAYSYFMLLQSVAG